MRVGVLVLVLGLFNLSAVADDSAAVSATDRSRWHIDRAKVERFARARAGDARDLLLGPAPRPPADTPRDLDCNELYQRRVTLMQQQAYTSPGPFWDDPRNQAGAVIGTVWTPAFAYLPIRAISSFYAAEHAPQRLAELDALRYQAASQRCFEH